jgi:hypothetical protein
VGASVRANPPVPVQGRSVSKSRERERETERERERDGGKERGSHREVGRKRWKARGHEHARAMGSCSIYECAEECRKARFIRTTTDYSTGKVVVLNITTYD